MAYFDNAATTYPKPESVYSFMDKFYREQGGSAGRGLYALANTAKGIVDDTRDGIKEVLACPAKQVVFTATATIALNIIIQGVIATGIKNVYISPFEHNAVTRILHHYETKGSIKVIELTVSKDLVYDLERIKYQFDAVPPDFLIISHASNVIGLIAPVEDICALAKKYNAVTLIDMAQTAGLISLNTGSENIDFAVFAGHKTLLGPTGISGFIMKPSFDLPPVFFGGTGYDSANQDMPRNLPERYEMGTMNTVGIAGLNAAVKWIRKKGISNIRLEEEQNRARLIELLSEYDFLRIVGNRLGLDYVGIVSCVMAGISSDSAGGIFAERNIAVRTGLQCAPSAHRFIGTFPAGTIRFSVTCLTADADFMELRNALDNIECDL